MIARVAAWLDSDLFFSFRSSPVTVAAAIVATVMILAALFAPVISPYDPFDPASIQLANSELPPAWVAGGTAQHLLGTDIQGRDLLSSILYGSRLSVLIGIASVLLAAVVGVFLGLLSGWYGGMLDAFLMRLADIQLSFPAILIVLLVNGVARAFLPMDMVDQAAIPLLIVTIALSKWVLFARTVRGSTLVERQKDYVSAARVLGVRPVRILLKHVLPNVTGPLLVIATINIALAILTEATLSYLGVGLPATQPSLGTLIRIGNEFLFSGLWWINVFPSLTLMMLVLSVNLIGDWLRDALNPKLRMKS